MSDDEWKQIRDAGEQLRDAERERRDFLLNRRPEQATLYVATSTCMAGLVPLIALVVWQLVVVARGELTMHLAPLVCATIAFALIYAPVGAACGYVAYWMCRESLIPERRMAIALALVVDVTVFGWVLWLAVAPPS